MTGISSRNPYVGPRPIQQGERIYGRESEILELFHLLQARRIVLLHSPSGAGKSSLVQAGLIPRLRQASFDVWRPIRVNLDPRGLDDVPTDTNRYVLSALLSLEEELPEARRRSPAELAGMSLLEYLDGRPRRKRRQDQGVVLLFDQFEEILTAEPTAVARKQELFDQLGTALEDGRYWALFIIREDYLGALAPYCVQLPTRLSNTFRLGLLGREAATQVAVESAKAGGRSFPAADVLIHDLSTISVQQPDGSFRTEQGIHVEPVQLQVVCRRLWDAMPKDALSIEEHDIKGRADVDEALAAYYADLVEHTAEADPSDERRIREWVGTCLITGGIRSQVRRGAEQSRGLDNALIERLQEGYLVRAEQRAGSLWFELSHDRLVEPVRNDNAAWEERHLHPLQIQAKLWEQQGRAESLLLRPVAALEARAWMREHAEHVTPNEREFVRRSRREHRRKQIITSVVLGLLAVAVGAAAMLQWKSAEARRSTVEAQRSAIEARKAEALAVELAGRMRDKVRLSVAQGIPDDPTTRAVLLREVERPTKSPMWRRMAVGVAESAVATRVLLHDGAVSSAVVSPSGAWLLTASLDGTARLWRSSDGHPLGVLPHGAPVSSAVFSPSGDRVVTASDDGKVRIWSVSTAGEPQGEPIVLEHGTSRVRSAVFSAGGTRVLTASGSHARVWSADGQGEPIVLPHASWVDLATFSPTREDEVLTKAYSETKATLWRIEGAVARVERVLEHDPHMIRSAAYAADGQRVVTASHGAVRVWPTSGTGEPVSLEDDGRVNTAVFAPDGEQVLTASSDGHVRIWPASGAPEPLVSLSTKDSATAAVYSSDGAQVLVTSIDGRAYAWRADGRGAPFELEHDGMITSAMFSTDGTLAITGTTGGQVRVWPLDVRPLVFSHQGRVNAVSFVASATRVLTASSDGTARLWSMDGVTDPVVLDHGQAVNVRSAVASTDGAMVVTTANDHVMRIWRTDAPDRPVQQLPYDRVEAAAVFPAGGDVVVAASSEPADPTRVEVWRIEGSGESAPIVLDIGREVEAIALAPDGRRALVVSVDGHVRVWSTDGRGDSRALEHGKNVWNAIFSPDGRHILTLAVDDEARVWPADGNGEPVVLHHDHEISSATFSPDGKSVLTTSHDWKAWLWRWSDQPAEPREIEPGGNIEAVAFTADSQWVAMVSSTGSAWMWRVDDPSRPLRYVGRSVRSLGLSPTADRILLAADDGTARVWPVRSTDELVEWLWNSTSYCLPRAERMALLYDTDDDAAAHVAACQDEVDERRAAR